MWCFSGEIKYRKGLDLLAFECLAEDIVGVGEHFLGDGLVVYKSLASNSVKGASSHTSEYAERGRQSTILVFAWKAQLIFEGIRDLIGFCVQ
jgi:hypothetical protein